MEFIYQVGDGFFVTKERLDKDRLRAIGPDSKPFATLRYDFGLSTGTFVTRDQLRDGLFRARTTVVDGYFDSKSSRKQESYLRKLKAAEQILDRLCPEGWARKGPIDPLTPEEMAEIRRDYGPLAALFDPTDPMGDIIAAEIPIVIRVAEALVEDKEPTKQGADGLPRGDTIVLTDEDEEPTGTKVQTLKEASWMRLDELRQIIRGSNKSGY